MKQPWLLKLLPALFLALLLLLAALQLARRFDVGDVYAPYSSYRSDPVGTRVLYEAALRMPGRSAMRWKRTLAELPGGNSTLALILGVEHVDKEDWNEIRSQALRGTRFLIALHPGISENAVAELGVPKCTESKELSLEKAVPRNLPNRIPWQFACDFQDWNHQWISVYKEQDRAGILEYRGGNIQLWGSSYLFSNEGLALDAQNPLLEATMGDAEQILFWEVPHGFQGTYSVAMLLQKNGFSVFVAAFLLTVALFLWNQTMLPGRIRPPAVIRPRDTIEGLAALFRRTIPTGQAFDLCMERWRRDCSRNISPKRRELLEELARKAPGMPFPEACKKAKKILN